MNDPPELATATAALASGYGVTVSQVSDEGQAAFLFSGPRPAAARMSRDTHVRHVAEYDGGALLAATKGSFGVSPVEEGVLVYCLSDPIGRVPAVTRAGASEEPGSIQAEFRERVFRAHLFARPNAPNTGAGQFRISPFRSTETALTIEGAAKRRVHGRRRLG